MDDLVGDLLTEAELRSIATAAVRGALATALPVTASELERVVERVSDWMRFVRIQEQLIELVLQGDLVVVAEGDDLRVAPRPAWGPLIAQDSNANPN